MLDHVQQSGAIVPVIWHIEVANILGLKQRAGYLSTHDLREAAALFRILPIDTDESTRHPNIDALLSLMDRVQLTAYDATYIDLALRIHLPLATFDKAMQEAARQTGVSLVLS